MKLISFVSACTLIISLASCNEKPKETNTIIIEKPVETPRKTVVVEEEDKRTTIKVNPNGGSVKTKDVDVEINK